MKLLLLFHLLGLLLWQCWLLPVLRALLLCVLTILILKQLLLLKTMLLLNLLLLNLLLLLLCMYIFMSGGIVKGLLQNAEKRVYSKGVVPAADLLFPVVAMTLYGVGSQHYSHVCLSLSKEEARAES